MVWFQCPWNEEDTPDLLIGDFLKHMRNQQNQGDYVFIGIAEIYEKKYDLPKLFEVFSKGYEFCAADKEFIKDILAHGYRHKSYTKDIHETIFSSHTTLVFRKL